ncbi:MAG TPA: SRPBCC family protein [Dehalococcoidia bacterium]
MEAERLIGAPAPTVCGLIADERQHHPRFLPPAFSHLTVEQGGVGDGTVVAFDLRVGGVRRRVRACITEEQPGRVLQGIDLDSGAVTTFDVTPEGDASRVRIRTAWHPAGGLRDWVERRLAPRLLLRLYGDEPANLDRYARAQARGG